MPRLSRISLLFFSGAMFVLLTSTLFRLTEDVTQIAQMENLSSVATPVASFPIAPDKISSTSVEEMDTDAAPTAPLDTSSSAIPATTEARLPGEVALEVFITGYSYWDNTPPGSSRISHGVVHERAGGVGTYADPITLAVGHSITERVQTLDFPPGTRFYLPYLQKYVIVEDTCGDGARPQDGPCHVGYQGKPWIDVYVDGSNTSHSLSVDCMNRITGIHAAIQNPGPDYPVTPGSLSESGCEVY